MVIIVGNEIVDPNSDMENADAFHFVRMPLEEGMNSFVIPLIGQTVFYSFKQRVQVKEEPWIQ